MRLLIISLALVLLSDPAWAVVLKPGDLVVALGGLGVAKVDPATGIQETIATVSAGTALINPQGIALESSGAILVADGGLAGFGRVVRVDPATGAQAILSSGGVLIELQDIALDENGTAMVTDDLALSVVLIDPATGGQTLLSLSGLLKRPRGIVALPGGGVLVADQIANVVVEVDPTGVQTIFASGPLLNNLFGITRSRAGYTYVVSRGPFPPTNPGVVEIDESTGDQRVVSSGGLLVNPFSIAVGRNGKLFVTDPGVGIGLARIVEIDPISGGQRLVVAANPAAFLPVGIAVVLEHCQDGIDNDGDGMVDYPNDPGCFDAASDNESPQCQDGVDNDGEVGTDFDGGVSAGATPDPNGADPDCALSFRNREATRASCGLGFELALLVPLLLAWRSRRFAGRTAA